MASRVAAVVLVGLLASGCAGDTEPEQLLAVDAALVPKTLSGRALGVYENTAPATVQAFANVGERALVGDGRVWEIRRNDRLVATLQISTMKDKVDLGDEAVRTQILTPILTGDVKVLRIADVEVNEVTSAGRKDVFVWFGQHHMEVLQVKDAGVASRGLVEELIRHQQSTSAWTPLSSSQDSDPDNEP